MLNNRNRRYHRSDEYELYDLKKARPFWKHVVDTTGLEMVSDLENYEEDFTVISENQLFYVELQVAAYWHNFDSDLVSNLYISKSKVDIMKSKITDPGINGVFVFLNCVPNRYMSIWLMNIDEKWLNTSSEGEHYYKIPVNNKYINRFTAKNMLNNLGEFYCDCKENHLNIMERYKGRLAQIDELYNIKGRNDFCCKYK